MASAHSRSDTRGRPPPKRWVFTCSGSNGSNTAHNSSEMRNPVVVRLFGVRSRSRFLVACLFIPPILPRFSGYSDRHLVRIKVFPFQNSPEKLFVGTADRALFRYSPNALVNLYGSVIDARWVSVLQVNKGTFHMPGQMISKTGNEMEDKLEELADILASLSDMTQGVKFPAVAVTPIAIFREI